MNWESLYDFLLSRGTWIAFGVCIVGLCFRCIYLYALSLDRDRVFYNHFSVSWALKSIFAWLVPLGSRGWRQQPLFSLAFFFFHLTFILVPLFLNAHNILWENAWGVSLPSLNDTVADWLTVVFIVSALVLLGRRILRPEVRFLTTWWDYTLLLLCSLPFITGFMAYHRIGPYGPVMVLHLLSAEVLLAIIPFTKLAHVVLYFFTRAFIGAEMGARRGARCW
ncbi:hypothetical protein [Thermodesulforhabdus norvegica]|uniref:Nitrate reductase gamma subunit n=1 Tax=Thermodesulforhabdus norvegica TaxID=39841 RepID=A0A1I4QK35_9BACT|nr:hypothetical protein [Thermodesulforhabdus norvegica]SFM40394.1 hypothetical protein SAMN05660836_00078 [Thermodesulforhabdus norvegica]